MEEPTSVLSEEVSTRALSCQEQSQSFKGYLGMLFVFIYNPVPFHVNTGAGPESKLMSS